MELLTQKVDLDKPGFAQFYCIHCAKYYIDDQAIQAHYKTKVSSMGVLSVEFVLFFFF